MRTAGSHGPGMVRMINSAVTDHPAETAVGIDIIAPMELGWILLAELAFTAASFVEVFAEGLALASPRCRLTGGSGATGLGRAPGITRRPSLPTFPLLGRQNFAVVLGLGIAIALVTLLGGTRT